MKTPRPLKHNSPLPSESALKTRSSDPGTGTPAEPSFYHSGELKLAAPLVSDSPNTFKIGISRVWKKVRVSLLSGAAPEMNNLVCSNPIAF